MRALGDGIRLALIVHLAAGETSVGDLSRAVGLERSLVSHHLGLLRAARLGTPRRHGKRVHYTLNGRADADRIQAAGSALVITFEVDGFDVRVRLPALAGRT